MGELVDELAGDRGRFFPVDEGGLDWPTVEMQFRPSSFWCLFFVLLSSLAKANEKSRYHLFNPTPQDQMREFVTDRPDKTESPISVDAGHFVIETDILNYTREKTDTTIIETTYWGLPNLKLGLNNWIDIQFVLEAFRINRTVDTSANTVDRRQGYGNSTVRLKMNMWGNDEGDTALAIMPYIIAPTSQSGLAHNFWEGGIIVPVSAQLPNGWSLGVMLQYDHKRNGASDGYHPQFITSVTTGHDLVGDLAFYVEVWNQSKNDAGSRPATTLDFGFTYMFNPDFQLDTGLNSGITDGADDTNLFAGLSLRI